IAFANRAAEDAAVAPQYADEVDREARFPHETLAALKETRLLSILIPEELGGESASLSDIAEICSLIGQNCASSAMMYAMHNIKVSSLVSHGRDSNWHRGFMQRISDEQLLLASATTEGGIGGDLRNSICAVEIDGENFKLGKDATVISYGARRRDPGHRTPRAGCAFLRSGDGRRPEGSVHARSHHRLGHARHAGHLQRGFPARGG